VRLGQFADAAVAREQRRQDRPARRIGERGEGLSGGQKQSIAIARALLQAPAALLMDEPTSSMDHNTEQAILAHLKAFLRGRTLVLSTHKPAMLELVERVVVLDGGRVVADGPRDTVLQALAKVPQRA